MIKCSAASLAFYPSPQTRLINSIKHEHSCKILSLLLKSLTEDHALDGKKGRGKACFFFGGGGGFEYYFLQTDYKNAA